MTLNLRNDFGSLLNSLNAQHGVELGVAKGVFTDALLSSSNLVKLTGVDKWDDERHGPEEKASAEKLLSKHGTRCELQQSSFHEALSRFEDESLDFIYVDGYAHTGQEDGATLIEWWPKLKPGGIFAGHDYHAQWPKTVGCVNRFVAMVGLPLHLTSADEYPSWYVFKKSAAMRGAEPVIPGLSGIPVDPDGQCILVGNGPSLTGSNLGSKIDAFDDVIRFNDFVTSGFEADVGTKTTIWCAGGRNKVPSSSKTRPNLKIVGGRCHFINRPTEASTVSALPDKVLFLHGETGNPGYAPKQLWRIPMEHFNAIRAQVRQMSQRENKDVLLPSAGLVAASWLIKNGVKCLTLAGFDHFSKEKGANHHYWVNRRRSFSDPVEHDPLVERELFSKWFEEKRVAYLH